ncbi:MAG: NUDIX hydrolase [Candidatus Promineifilaceae bacterium]|nr:NUDIX hydrolase [Candidatus Promineifilaceae bacterium]
MRHSWIKPLLGLAVRLLVPRQRVGVALVAFNNRGQVLMLRHVFHPVTPWGLPGGWLGRNENPADCALRELAEETGLHAELGPVVYLTHEPVPPHLGIVFRGRIADASKLTLNSEILEAGWFELTDLPGPLLPFTHKAIAAAAESIALPAREGV